MNGRTSHRSFVALATGALASLASAGLGRVFGQGATARADRHYDAAAPHSDDLIIAR